MSTNWPISPPRAPLLFKGGDSGLTDVMAHPASIRT